MVNMRNWKKSVDSSFFEEELFRTQQALFAARTIKELKFLQNKLNYLRRKMKELNQK
jgi:hypothetical protein